MHEAGTPMEGILLALEAVEARDNAAAAKRAQTAARKQAQRDRERDSHATVTGHDADSPDESPSLDKSPQTPKINPTPHVHTHETPARRATVWPCPEGVDPLHWSDFLANRKRKKLTNSVTAHEGVLADLAEKADDDWPPGRLVKLAAAKGWGSINYPSDGPNNDRRNGTHTLAGNRAGSASGLGRVVDAAHAFIADGGHH